MCAFHISMALAFWKADASIAVWFSLWIV